MSAFHWLCKFDLDLLLGIDAKKYKNSIGLCQLTNIQFCKYYLGFGKIVRVKAGLSFIVRHELIDCCSIRAKN